MILRGAGRQVLSAQFHQQRLRAEMALPEVPQVLSSEDEIMSHSLLGPQLICASRWSSESNKPGTWTQVGPGQQLGGQTVAH